MALKYSKANITAMLASIVRVEQAILTIDNNQTGMERSSRSTINRNGRGWSSRDARFGGSLASQIRSKGSGKLSSKQLKAARQLLPKYWRQLQAVCQDWESSKAPVQKPATPAPAAAPQPSPDTITCKACGYADCEADARFCGLCGAPVGTWAAAKTDAGVESHAIQVGEHSIAYLTAESSIAIPERLLRKYSNRRMATEIAKLSDAQLSKWVRFETNLLRRKDRGWKVFWDGRGELSSPRTVMTY